MTKYETQYIPDGMSVFERNVKRAVDMLGAAVCLIIFSPSVLSMLYSCEARGWWPGYLQAREDWTFRTTVLHI